MIVWGLGLVIRSFFGGWWDTSSQTSNIQTPQSSNTWFVNDLINSWNLQENNPNIEESPNIEENSNTAKNDYTEIKVMMPRYFDTIWRKDFANDLYSGSKILITFIYIDDLNQYRDTISNEGFSDADIFLFPYDRSDFVSTQSFSFQKNLKPAFDEFVSSIVEGTDTSFLPFSADPMIMYILSGYNLTDLDDITNFAYDRASRNPIAFPIFYGITDEDYYGKWFWREYKDITRYALLHFFTSYPNLDNLLSARIDSNAFENYNISSLNTILSKIDIHECKYFPSICFQIYNFVWLRFWFLSDIDIVKTYFSAKESKFDEIKKEKVPFSQYEVPVRIRWRSIPNSLTDIDRINAVYRFLVQYMNWNTKYNLRNSTLPVFSSQEWYTIIDNSFIWFRWYVLTTWWNFIKKLLNTRSFRQLLDYEITAKDFLKNS